MSRVLILGIAVFLAVVGLALFASNGTSTADAGGCHSCHGGGGFGCFGCRGILGRCHGYHRCHGYGCHGYGHGCHGGYGHGCHGGYGHGCHGHGAPAGPPAEGGVPDEGGGVPPAPPEPPEKAGSKPLQFRTVSFRR